MHVLGTPPAFILSQDQTLVKKFSLGPGKTTRFSYPVTYCFWVGISRCLSLNYSSQKNLQGRCLLFSYQSSWCFRCFRQPYQIITSSSVCQQLFLFFSAVRFRSFVSAALTCDSCDRISCCKLNVNAFFQFFSYFFITAFSDV